MMKRILWYLYTYSFAIVVLLNVANLMVESWNLLFFAVFILLVALFRFMMIVQSGLRILRLLKEAQIESDAYLSEKQILERFDTVLAKTLFEESMSRALVWLRCLFLVDVDSRNGVLTYAIV